MGKIRVRKKLRKKIKDNSTLISYGLIALSVLFIFFMFLIFTGNDNSVFKVEDRTKEVKDSLKNDTDDFKTIGWVKVQGTNIDYPVLKFVSTQYEMPVNDFSYAWTVNDGSKLDKRIDIAGHNILNLSRKPTYQELHSKSYPSNYPVTRYESLELHLLSLLGSHMLVVQHIFDHFVQ